MPIESTQRKLDRVRPPRVHIAYDVELGDAIEKRELPFVIGVLGDFSALSVTRQPWKERAPILIDWDNFDDVLGNLQPRLRLTIPGSAGEGEWEIDLTFRRIDDFAPEQIIGQIEPRADQEATRRVLDTILHAPEFQRLESTWRGLQYLVSHTETSSQLMIKLIDVGKKELHKDLKRAPEFDQSLLFRKLYEEVYGTFGGDPFALLLGDYTFSSSFEDIELLSGVAAVAAACLAPFIAAAGPEFLGLESFADLARLRDPGRIFDSPEYTAWRLFRQSPDSRYVGLTIPRILLRSPYGLRPGTSESWPYEEDTAGGHHLLWGSSAYALAVCIANAFARYGWCGGIRGPEGGGLVEGLPTWIHESEEEGKGRSAVEIPIDDRQEKEFADLGFIPLAECKGPDSATFFSIQSCCQPARYLNDEANANSRLSCQLEYILTGSRFMHYLKVIGRDRVGSYHTRGGWEQLLNSWISNYVLFDDAASSAIKARYPLREARIEVAEHPERPGVYRVVAFLRPHYQLDELSVSLRFIADLA